MNVKMKDNTLILCPAKETMVYKWVCKEKCTLTPAQCEAARADLKKTTRHCVDCENYGNVQPCKTCLGSDPDYRERPFWAQKKAAPVLGQTPVQGLQQLRLF